METAISINKYIYSILKNDDQLSKLVGNNIFPVIAEESVKFPFIIFKKTSLNAEYTKDLRLYDSVEISILIASIKYDQGITIAERVRDLLECRKEANLKEIRLVSNNEDYIDNTYIQELVFRIIVN